MAHAFALADTVVVDDPAVETPMQVLIDGEWHRRLPTLSHAACAIEIKGQFFPVRPEVLSGRLCPLCFTPFERSLVPKEDRHA